MAFLLVVRALAVTSLGRRGVGGIFPVQSKAHPSTANCTVSWFNQTLDHFSWAAPDGRTTYRQRYFEYDGYYEAGGPIWFYCGNEASVELYVNATGLMWENAARFGALLVFAEHRYYGESQPFLPIDGSGDWRAQPLQYLTHEQAIADYAVLIGHIRSVRGITDRSTAVIAFGGSYGGMLAAWIRIKYPGTVDGAIAGMSRFASRDLLPPILLSPPSAHPPFACCFLSLTSCAASAPILGFEVSLFTVTF